MLVWFYWIWPIQSSAQLWKRLAPYKYNFLTRDLDGFLILTMCFVWLTYGHFRASNHSWLVLHMCIFLLVRVNLNSPSAIFLTCWSVFPPTEERKSYIIYLMPRHHLEQQPAQTATDLHLIEVKSLHKADTPFIQNTGGFLLYFLRRVATSKALTEWFADESAAARLSRPVPCLTLFCLNGNDGALRRRFKGTHPHIMAGDINRWQQPPCRRCRGSKWRLCEWMWEWDEQSQRGGGSKIRTPVQLFEAKVATISPRQFVLSMEFGCELVMEAWPCSFYIRTLFSTSGYDDQYRI